jgi:hypothetical protein
VLNKLGYRLLWQCEVEEQHIGLTDNGLEDDRPNLSGFSDHGHVAG